MYINLRFHLFPHPGLHGRRMAPAKVQSSCCFLHGPNCNDLCRVRNISVHVLQHPCPGSTNSSPRFWNNWIHSKGRRGSCQTCPLATDPTHILHHFHEPSFPSLSIKTLWIHFQPCYHCSRSLVDRENEMFEWLSKSCIVQICNSRHNILPHVIHHKFRRNRSGRDCKHKSIHGPSKVCHVQV